MPRTSDAIEASFELASARCNDITPLVYARLFARHPEWEGQFCLDKTGARRGSMLVIAIEVLLDHIGDRRYSESFIRAEAMNHVATHDVSIDAFVEFYDTMADTIRDLAGPDWTNEMALAWRHAIGDVRTLVAGPAA